MKWIKINEDNLPPFGEKVIITDEQLNKQENKVISTVALLEGVWENENGKSPRWEDIYNSGLINPTHFCRIPPLNL